MVAVERNKSHEEELIATYVRKSTLWKNANAFYVAQDWTKAECLFIDFSDRRQTIWSGGFRFLDDCGNDITSEIVEHRFYDRYTIRLTNERGTNSKDFDFRTREEANRFFRDEVLRNKYLTGWKRVA